MKNWEYKNNITEKNSSPSVDELITLLLENRGLADKQLIESFLNPRLTLVTVEQVGIDREQVSRAIKRIHEAIEKHQKIIVYGDYDVDGITGAAILWETLHRMGADVMPYIPNRVDEGYGLSIKGITNLQKEYENVKLIITVDNGIVANQAVDFAQEQHIEVIITDHHVSAGDAHAVAPNAHSIVHTTQLCGAGVAYVLSNELRASVNKQFTADEDNQLELAALGTIADLVPLTAANRTLVMHGLKKLQKTKRKGLQALYSESEIDPTSIGVYQVGHQIGPRLNATGRMESAMDSLRLLCTKDASRAFQLASLLGKVNRERQQVMQQATEHASLSVKKRDVLKKLLIIHDSSYPEGVIGLVAGRLVEEYYRPAIVIARGVEKSKGSVRSVNGFNIIEFLRQSSEYFVNVGGHPMAAGFTVETEKLDALQKLLEDMAEELVGDDILIRSLKIDTRLPFTMITSEAYLAIQKLGPFGMGNPEPTFVSERVEVKDMRLLGKERKHLRLILQQDFGQIVEAIAFGMGEWYTQLTAGDLIDVAYTIDENTWQGTTKLQLKVKDLKKS